MSMPFGDPRRGLAYDEGRGIPEDAKQATEWWRRAASQGHTSAQLKLALAYSKGRGVRRDRARAFFFAEIAASRLPPDTPAPQRQPILALRDSLEAALPPGQVAEVKQAAAGWQPEP